MEFTCLSGRKRSKSAVLEIFKRDEGVNRMYNILVCDDDREIVEAIEIYLSQEGYRILKAYDGIEALNILEKEKINLLIIDVMMPRLDGIRATLKIREKNSIPIIILSAKSEDADKILGLNVGADDYVTKPFSPLELVARVKSQLRRYNQLGGSGQGEQEKSLRSRRPEDQRRPERSDCGWGAGEAYTYRIQYSAPAYEESGKGILHQSDL